MSCPIEMYRNASLFEYLHRAREVWETGLNWHRVTFAAYPERVKMTHFLRAFLATPFRRAKKYENADMNTGLGYWVNMFFCQLRRGLKDLVVTLTVSMYVCLCCSK